MNVLLSWSGKTSHEIAKHLKDWLPLVLPDFDPWVSSEDIDKGTFWWEDLHRVLAEVKAVVVVVTPDNVHSPWLYYEAGAVAAKVGANRVCPYLVKVPIKHVQGTPFGGYQLTEADKEDTLKLVRSLHKFVGSPHNPTLFEGNFSHKWPSIRSKMEHSCKGLEMVEDEVTATKPSVMDQLSEEAKELLRTAAAEGPMQGLFSLADLAGIRIVLCAGKPLGDHTDPRGAAKWTAALKELSSHSLVEPTKPGVFIMTDAGYQIADVVKSA